MAEKKDIADQVMISPAVLAAWHELAMRVLAPLLSSQQIRPEEIPDEELHLRDDGELEVVAILPRGLGEVRMHVPRAQWTWKS